MPRTIRPLFQVIIHRLIHTTNAETVYTFKTSMVSVLTTMVDTSVEKVPNEGIMKILYVSSAVTVLCILSVCALLFLIKRQKKQPDVAPKKQHVPPFGHEDDIGGFTVEGPQHLGQGFVIRNNDDNMEIALTQTTAGPPPPPPPQNANGDVFTVEGHQYPGGGMIVANNIGNEGIAVVNNQMGRYVMGDGRDGTQNIGYDEFIIQDDNEWNTTK
eukprot:928241_1